MKYPQEQFRRLVIYLPILMKVLGIMNLTEVSDALLHHLHYCLFAQLNYTDDNHNVLNTEGKRFAVDNGKRLFTIDDTFKLYPDGCTDDHILTAMKKAVAFLRTNPG